MSIEAPGQVMLYRWPLVDPSWQGLKPTRVVRLITPEAVIAVERHLAGQGGRPRGSVDLDRYAYFALLVEEIASSGYQRWLQSPKSLISIDLGGDLEFPGRVHDLSRSIVRTTENMQGFIRYWVPFFEALVLPPGRADEELPFTLPYFIPDVFYERLDGMDQAESRLHQLSSRLPVDRVQVEREIDELYGQMLERLFSPPAWPFWYERKLDFSLKLHPGPRETFNIWYEDGNWSVHDFEGYQFDVTEQPTLKECWLAFEQMLRKGGHQIYRESERETWEKESLILGDPCYDVDIYFALGVESPVLFPTEAFKTWIASSTRLCSDDVGPAAPTQFIDAVEER